MNETNEREESVQFFRVKDTFIQTDSFANDPSLSNINAFSIIFPSQLYIDAFSIIFPSQLYIDAFSIIFPGQLFVDGLSTTVVNINAYSIIKITIDQCCSNVVAININNIRFHRYGNGDSTFILH
jgi:hypothetical protein